MTQLVSNATTGIASRSSRKSFLGRTGKVMLGIVGAAAASAAFPDQAHAGGSCPCSQGNGCQYQTTCDCVGNKITYWYRCPNCETELCTYTQCTTILCV